MISINSANNMNKYCNKGFEIKNKEESYLQHYIVIKVEEKWTATPVINEILRCNALRNYSHGMDSDIITLYFTPGLITMEAAIKTIQFAVTRVYQKAGKSTSYLSKG